MTEFRNTLYELKNEHVNQFKGGEFKYMGLFCQFFKISCFSGQFKQKAPLVAKFQL